MCMCSDLQRFMFQWISAVWRGKEVGNEIASKQLVLFM